MSAQSWSSWFWQWTIGGLAGTVAVGVSKGVVAQVVPDNTLGAESSVVTPNVTIRGIDSDRLDGGATRGANLFHSFGDFNVEEGRGVYFANPTGIENILTRVTGSNASNIMGRLGVLGGANLLLLNPNGILFGKNAQLDIEGSFLGSTASSFTFPNSSEFSATNPQAPPLLTISIPLGLQYGSNPGNIEVQGSNLQVNPGKTLALIGGNLSINGGQIQAAGGRIELGGVAGEGTVGLSINNSNIGLSFPISDGVSLSDIFLDNSTTVNVSAGGDGSLAINAHNLEMAGGSGLQAGASWLVPSDNSPGEIKINATGAVNLSEDSFIDNSVFSGATGEGGDINITADSLALTSNAQLRADSFGTGDAGNLNIITREGISFDGVGTKAESVIASGAEGQGGQINITTRSLSVSDGATLVAHTFGQGNAGDVKISATDAISLEGSATGIGSQVFAGAEGNGGSINITTDSLSASGGATLVTSTSGEGNGGSINVTTDSLSASGGATLAANTFGQGDAGDVKISANDATSLEGSATGIGSQVFAGAEGNGGSINITTGSLSASGGATLAANTSGEGDAGDVKISANDATSLEGSATGIGSQVFAGAKGNGGSINITTGSLSASGGATLAANTSGEGDAGDVKISANDATSLEGSATGIGSQVFAGAKGNGGSINITTGSLSASGGATLAANTSGEGDAGDVKISANDATSLEGSATGIGSQVFAGAKGNGGSINITTGSLSASGGATLTANTSGEGDAGDVKISANDAISLEGVGIETEVTGIGSQVIAGAEGNGGKIEITASSLSVSNGARLIASTAGKGNGGDVNIRVRDTVSFDGIGINGKNSGVFSSVEVGGEGEGGNISVTVDNLSIANGAVLDAQTQTNFKAGNIIINTGNIIARNGTITTSAEQSFGGRITITAYKIRLFGDSDITTNVNSGAGGGGNIYLEADSILAFDDSDILAFAQNEGGDITLKTPAFFGENYRPAPSGTNPDLLDNNNQVDINATGAVSGNITIPDVSFIQNSLTELPENQLNTDTILANSCIVRRNRPTQGSFIITGTGGLPQRPGDAQTSSFPTVDVATLPQDSTSTNSTSTNHPWQKGDPIVEPQGVYRLPNGKLVLSRACS